MGWALVHAAPLTVGAVRTERVSTMPKRQATATVTARDSEAPAQVAPGMVERASVQDTLLEHPRRMAVSLRYHPSQSPRLGDDNSPSCQLYYAQTGRRRCSCEPCPRVQPAVWKGPSYAQEWGTLPWAFGGESK